MSSIISPGTSGLIFTSTSGWIEPDAVTNSTILPRFTSDNSILPKGTAYQTDVGMTGNYNSVIGFDIENPIHGFTKGYRLEGGFIPAKDPVSICGALVETDDITGLAKSIISIKET